MIYLIFTPEGFDEAKTDIIKDKAVLWVNDNVLSDQQKNDLATNGIMVNILPTNANPKNEKSVLSALQHVEQHASNTDILVEYL
jgi:hypothetical protein